MDVSFIIPIFNEVESIRTLTCQIRSVMESNYENEAYEILLVDDGSSDCSWDSIKEDIYSDGSGNTLGLRLRRNFGKATALACGFQKSRGEIVFTLDADLQDDPTEIPRFIGQLNKGFDLVSGWKRSRNDPLSKKIPSKVFNWVTAKLTGVKLNDFNCGFKCYRREVIENLNLYGELHRYIPVLADDLGYKIGEIEVRHHPRKHGISKYGFERYARGLVDLVTVLSTTKWLNKPGHLFGGVGLLFGVLGGAALMYLSVLWILGLGPIGDRPLLILGVMLSIFSLQMFSLGVVAEIFIKLRGRSAIDSIISEKRSNRS